MGIYIIPDFTYFLIVQDVQHRLKKRHRIKTRLRPKKRNAAFSTNNTERGQLWIKDF